MTSLTELEKKALAHAGYGEHLRPARDWFILLALSAVLFLGSIAWNVWIYEEVITGSLVTVPAESVPTTDTDAFSAAGRVFTSRAAEESRYENTYQFVDPSK